MATEYFTIYQMIAALVLGVCFFLIIYAYFLYPLLLLILRSFSGQQSQFAEGDLPAVSVIIAALNEEKSIKARIENLLKLDYPKERLEIIIASDGSTDRTAEIAGEFSAQGVTVLDFKHRRGKVNVLNEVVPKARHGIVVFSDANTFFQPDAVRKLVRRFVDPKVGCVCGLLRFTTAEGSTSGDLEGVYWRFETFLKTVEGSFGALLGANGAIFAIRRELFYKCPPDTIIEDFVVPMKILERGYQVVYEPDAVALEDAAQHIVHEKKRRIRIGAGDFQSISLLQSMLDIRRGFPAFAFWSHKILRWCTPFYMLLVFGSNLLLLGHPLFQFTFAAQCVFYGLGILGQMLTWAGLPVKVLNLFYYFISMNLALFLGFITFISRRHSVKWERTER